MMTSVAGPSGPTAADREIRELTADELEHTSGVPAMSRSCCMELLRRLGSRWNRLVFLATYAT